MNIEGKEKIKIEILELDEEKIKKLKSLEFKKCTFSDDSSNNYDREKKVINVKDIVGTARMICNQDNWFDYMIKDAHKMSNFEEFSENKDSYEDFLLRDSNDLPSVYEYNNKYYIARNGKHRIVIAKCFGIDKIMVISIKIK